MRTWLDLEERFRALAPMRLARLDIQWGAAGDHWYVAGTNALGPNLRQFETLCGIGGRFLQRSLDPKSELAQELLAESDPTIRWYRLLKRQGNGLRQGPNAYEIDDAGNRKGDIYTATIDDVLDISANQCLELEAQFPVRDDKKWYAHLYDDYGKELIRGAFNTLIAAIIAAALAYVGAKWHGT